MKIFWHIFVLTIVLSTFLGEIFRVFWSHWLVCSVRDKEKSFITLATGIRIFKTGVLPRQAEHFRRREFDSGKERCCARWSGFRRSETGAPAAVVEDATPASHRKSGEIVRSVFFYNSSFSFFTPRLRFFSVLFHLYCINPLT
jgi:hypothetical protein